MASQRKFNPATIVLFVSIGLLFAGLAVWGAAANAAPSTEQPSTAALELLREKGIENYRQDGAGCGGFVSVSGSYLGEGRVVVRLVRLNADTLQPEDVGVDGYTARKDPEWGTFVPNVDRVALDRKVDRTTVEQRFEIRAYVPTGDRAAYRVQVTSAEQAEGAWSINVSTFTSVANCQPANI